MRSEPQKLFGLQLFIPTLYRDERGFFLEMYQKDKWTEWGAGSFVQDNLSFSKKNVLRGLHFQKSPGQDKLISCLQGEIWDVALDLRVDSPTFLQWQAVILSEENCHQFFIPKGFAHGFCVLSETALVHYKVSAPYDPLEECSLRWNDSRLQIPWPIVEPILSFRDQTAPFLEEVLDALDYR